MPNKKRPDRETLRTLYLVDKIGSKNIGLIYGVDQSLVQQWLRNYNIPRHGMSKSAKLRISRTYKVGAMQDVDVFKEEPYILLNVTDMINLEKQGRLTKLW